MTQQRHHNIMTQHHRRQQQEQSEVSDGSCDESKCVSTGLSQLSNNSFTCYGDGEFYPMMCADGYQARVVEGESPVDNSGAIVQYFTCCPPDLLVETNVSRHCANPIATVFPEFATEEGADDDYTITMICNDDTREYSRQMKTNEGNDKSDVEWHMCCDSIIVNDENTTDFLDDTECVPYHNEFYAESKVQNKYGMISAITCDFPDGDFEFPRLVEINDSLSTSYECCKTGPAIPPFVQDTAFKLTIYPQIVLSSFAIISSIIMILGLSIPLLIQLKNGTAQMSRQTNRRRRISRSSSFGQASRSSSAVSQGSQRLEVGYNPYNLYLVYMAIPDLVINICVLGLYGSYVNQNSKVVFCSFLLPTANLYLNAVVAYEVLILLRNSHQTRKSDPPSLLKVTIQATVVYFFAIIASMIFYFVIFRASESDSANSKSDSAMLIFNLVVFVVVPFGAVGTVCTIIWWRGYLPSMNGISARDKAMRELACYFFRIIGVFIACWAQGIIIASLVENYSWGFVVGGLFLAIQPIVSTGMAMTKSDVKKYIFDLITLSYVRSRTTKTEEEELRITEELPVQTETTSNRTRKSRGGSTRSESICTI